MRVVPARAGKPTAELLSLVLLGKGKEQPLQSGALEYLVIELSQACFVSYPEKALGTRLSLLAHLLLGISHSVYRRQIYY